MTQNVTPISAIEITNGAPFDNALLQKFKDNFDDLNVIDLNADSMQTQITALNNAVIAKATLNDVLAFSIIFG